MATDLFCYLVCGYPHLGHAFTSADPMRNSWNIKPQFNFLRADQILIAKLDDRYQCITLVHHAHTPMVAGGIMVDLGQYLIRLEGY
jgi:hypothetical protein